VLFARSSQGVAERDPVGMQATRDARPIHRVSVDGFWMDRTAVTNEEFARFVSATGYVTVAECRPSAEEFPGTPPEDLVAGSAVFAPPDHQVPLDDYLQLWTYVPGADWRHPTGPSSGLRGREYYPVVQVAYEDAEAYARWASPTTTRSWRARAAPSAISRARRPRSIPRSPARHARDARRIVSLHGSVLLALHRRHAGQRRGAQRSQSSRLPLREECGLATPWLERRGC
jgi:hypothetical protein